MSTIFREFLKKIGSGPHTSEDLTREESETATRMMLLQEATPAQIGAFMIAHRIKRPTAIELAGMLDAYEQLGPKIFVDNLVLNKSVTVLGNPYDGRSRTSPVTPITALILASVGVTVGMHGGDCMPTKYGIPLGEIWQGLGVNFSNLSQTNLEKLLKKTGLTFVYIPTQFPLAQQLVAYREELGKRPPLATLELIWSPYIGNIHVVAGFVHPPTEERFQEALKLRGITQFTTVKGLEGSCDLACSRTAIIGLVNFQNEPNFERLLLNPRNYNFTTKDLPLESLEQLIKDIQAVLNNQDSNLKDAAILNGGFYLWRFGVCESLEAGFTQAETLLKQGKVAEKLSEIAKTSSCFAPM